MEDGGEDGGGEVFRGGFLEGECTDGVCLTVFLIFWGGVTRHWYASSVCWLSQWVFFSLPDAMRLEADGGLCRQSIEVYRESDTERVVSRKHSLPKV